MRKSTLTAAVLLTCLSGAALAQYNNQWDPNGSRMVEQYNQDRADAAKRPFGNVMKDREGESCARQMTRPSTPAEFYDQAPSYACQAWYWSNKEQGLFTSYVVPAPETYNQWYDDVARVRLVHRKVKDLAAVRSMSYTPLGRSLFAPGRLPASITTLVASLDKINTTSLTMDLAADVALVEQLNPMPPARMQLGYTGPSNPRESQTDQEARLLGGPKPAALPAVAAPTPPSASEISARALAKFRTLPTLAAPLKAYTLLLDMEFALRREGGGPDRVARAIDEEAQEIVAARRYLAQHPENGFAKDGVVEKQKMLDWYRTLQREPNCPAWIGQLLEKADAAK